MPHHQSNCYTMCGFIAYIVHPLYRFLSVFVTFMPADRHSACNVTLNDVPPNPLIVLLLQIYCSFTKHKNAIITLSVSWIQMSIAGTYMHKYNICTQENLSPCKSSYKWKPSAGSYINTLLRTQSCTAVVHSRDKAGSSQHARWGRYRFEKAHIVLLWVRWVT